MLESRYFDLTQVYQDKKSFERSDVSGDMSTRISAKLLRKMVKKYFRSPTHVFSLVKPPISGKAYVLRSHDCVL